MTKTILLTQNKYALVDDDDYEKTNAYKWHYSEKDGALRNTGKTTISMHRFILLKDKKSSLEIDHINHIKTDNRKENLRLCKKSDNLKNKNKYKNNKSGYKGVYKGRKYFVAEIRVDTKKIFLGNYENPVDAAKAYDDAARKYHKEFAKTNF